MTLKLIYRLGAGRLSVADARDGRKYKSAKTGKCERGAYTSWDIAARRCEGKDFWQLRGAAGGPKCVSTCFGKGQAKAGVHLGNGSGVFEQENVAAIFEVCRYC